MSDFTNPLRAYATGVDRQQTSTRIVYTEDDIRRALTAAYKTPSKLSVIRLGKDIALSRPLTIQAPTGWSGVIIEGGGQFVLRTSAAMDYMLEVSGGTAGVVGQPGVGAVVRDLRIDVLHAVTDVVKVSGTYPKFATDGLDIYVGATVGHVFSVTATANRVHLSNTTVFIGATVGAVTDVLRGDPADAGAPVSSLSIDGMYLESGSATVFTTSALEYCRLSRIVGHGLVSVTAALDNCHLSESINLTPVDISSGAGSNLLVDIFCSAGSGSLTVDPNDQVIGCLGYTSVTGGTAVVSGDVAFSSTRKCLPVASGGGTTNYYRADGTWAAPPGATSAIGDTVTSGTVGSVLFIGTGPVLAQDNANLFWDDANNRLGIGTATPAAKLSVVAGTLTGTTRAIENTATLAATPGGTATAEQLTVTSAGSAATNQIAHRITLNAGFTGAAATRTVLIENFALGTLTTALTSGDCNFGIDSNCVGDGPGHRVGFSGRAGGGAVTIGTRGRATAGDKASATYIGAFGQARNQGAGAIRVGGFFGLSAAVDEAGMVAPTLVDCAAIFDNDTVAAPIALFRDNGTVVMCVIDGGNVGIVATAPVSKLDVDGSFGLDITSTTTTPFTLDSTHHTLLVDATAGAKTVNLPAASGCTRRRYTVKKTDSSANAVTLDGNASETIDGAATYALATQYKAVTVQCDGTNWHVVAVV